MLQKYSTYIFCFLISLLVVALYVNDFSSLEKLEWKIQDFMYSLKSDNPTYPDIVMVNIDERTTNEFGEWPWTRDKIADLLAAIGSGEPKTVLLDIPLDQDISMDTAGHTEILAGQMSWMKNVIVPYDFSPAEYIKGKISNPKYLYNSSIEVNSELGILKDEQSLLANRVFLPSKQICKYSAGLGFRANVFDDDRKIRWEPLTLHYQGYYYPSAPLMAAAHYLGKPAALISIQGGEYVQLGMIQIPTNQNGNVFINYNKPKRSFINLSAFDILNESQNTNLLDKLVIINVVEETFIDSYKTPVDDKLVAGEKTANVIENIIHNNFINRVDASPGTDILILIILGGAFAFILPRVSLMYRVVILIVTFIVLANLNFILFNSAKLMIRSLYICMELFLLFLVTPFLDKKFLERFSKFHIGFEDDEITTKLPKVDLPESKVIRSEKPDMKPVEEGIKTETVEPFKTPEVPPDPAKEATVVDGSEISATAALNESAPEISETSDELPMEYNPPGITDEKTDADANEPPLEETVEKRETSQVEYPTIMGQNSKKPKNLGRYEVIGVLGKGAMGTVYKGVDPAIDRNVALKTIRLDFVNDPSELAELKERLSREAKAAGMLSHPNIVTIYDVGAEGSLQYIAMEYLEGETLEDMIRKKVKFNYRIIAQIITQICTALDFAHNQGIVHRDIKPANIMVLKDYSIKVMDFGIARVDSSSMTRTGIAMGTPNYISPEQLQGKPVDKRCDIFSLGVVMYEMLIYRRPFKGENLTSLIYSIVNADAELPSAVNPSIPHLFDRVIEKALHKNPDERYQHASEIAAQLSDFIQSFIAKH